MKLCPVCGAQNEDVSNFCTTCGARLAVSEPEQPVQEEPAAALAPESVSKPEVVLASEEIDPWQAFAPSSLTGAPSPAPTEEGGVAVADPPAEDPVCPSCGAPWKEGAQFCVSCGAALPAPEPEPELEPEPEPKPAPEPAQEVVCPSCGTVLAAGAKFCINCGTSLASAPAPEPEPVCPSCGTVLAVGAKFCTNCGTRMVPASSEEPAQDETPQEKKEPKAPKKKNGGLARAVTLWLALLCFVGMLAVCFLWNGMEIFSMRVWDNYDEAALLHESFQEPELTAARESLGDEEWASFSAYLEEHTQQDLQRLYDECGLSYFSTYTQARATLNELRSMTPEEWEAQYQQWEEDVRQWEEQNQQYAAVLQSQLGQMCQDFRTAGGENCDFFWNYLNLWRYSLRGANLRFDGFSSEFIQNYSSLVSALKELDGSRGVDAAGSSLMLAYLSFASTLAQADEERWEEFCDFYFFASRQDQQWFIEDYFPDVPMDDLDRFLTVIHAVFTAPDLSEWTYETTPGLMVAEDGTVSQYTQLSIFFDALGAATLADGWYSWWNLFSERLPMTMTYFDEVDPYLQLVSLYDFLLCCGMTDRELEDLLELITLYANASDNEIISLTQVLGGDLDGEAQPPAFPIETPFPEESQEAIITAVLRLEAGAVEDVLLPLYLVGVQSLPRLYTYQGLESRLQALRTNAPYAAEAYDGLTEGTLSATMLQVRQYGAYLFWPIAALMLLLVLVFALAPRGKVVGALAAILGGALGLAYAWMGPMSSQEMTLRIAAAALAGSVILLALLALTFRSKKAPEETS